MEIMKIITTLQSFDEGYIMYKMGDEFATAVTEAVKLLVAQGERIAELEEAENKEHVFGADSDRYTLHDILSGHCALSPFGSCTNSEAADCLFCLADHLIKHGVTVKGKEMPSEDITFCANKKCEHTKCERNPKHIRLPIPHSFACYTHCPRWKDDGAEWLSKLTKEGEMITEKRLIRYEDVYQYAFKGTNGGSLEDEEFDAIVNAIESVPFVDAAEVVHGDWIDGRPFVNSRWKVCSVCHQTAPEPHAGYNYCPNCGAKMDGGGSADAE